MLVTLPVTQMHCVSGKCNNNNLAPIQAGTYLSQISDLSDSSFGMGSNGARFCGAGLIKNKPLVNVYDSRTQVYQKPELLYVT